MLNRVQVSLNIREAKTIESKQECKENTRLDRTGNQIIQTKVCDA